MSNLADLINFAKIRDTLAKQIEAEEYASFPYNQDNACIQIDAHIRDLDVKIAKELKNKLSNDQVTKLTASLKSGIYERIRQEKQALFNQMQCQNQLEKIKLIETKDIISKETKLYDEDVLSASKKTSQTYLLIGGGILLTSLFIILNSKKK